MVLELHVWGPAFSLPSVDPQCLAAIAYLSLLPIPDWVLVSSNDPSISPKRELPALRDGSTIVGGFANIVEHLRQKDERWDLDRNLNREDTARADIIAFSSLIESQGQSLLDLSLYVSSENYTSTTRPAYSKILHWPIQYLVPPQTRAHAKARTAHLGVSALDLDNADDDEQAQSRRESLIPASLRGEKQTVTSVLKQQQTTARFRLDALVDALCEVLDALLGAKPYFASNHQASTLDCLAAAYLSLMLKPDVPQKWLAEGITQRWPQLGKYANIAATAFWGDNWKETLPWRTPDPASIASTASSLLTNPPLTPNPFTSSILLNTEPNPDPTPTSSRPFLLPFSTVAVALTALSAYFVYPSIFTPAIAEPTNLSDMGEAGAMFAEMDFGSQNATPRKGGAVIDG